jgi:hypothetical protein
VRVVHQFVSENCPDCDGETWWGRLATTGTGLQVRLHVQAADDLTTNAETATCGDCGRIRFSGDAGALPADLPAVDDCPVCGADRVDTRVGGNSDDVYLSAMDGEGRTGLHGRFCTDCGSVGLYATGLAVADGGEGVDCPGCAGAMTYATPSIGASSVRVVGERKGSSTLSGRHRADPVAWVCEDCAVALFYDREA